MTVTAYPLDPLRDSRHRSAAAARDLQDWLSWLELGNKSARTLDTYERYAAVLLRDWPALEFSEFTDGELAHSLKKFPQKSRHVVKAAWNNWFKWGYMTRRIPGNPVDLLPAIKYKQSRIYDVFSEVEVAALCALPTPDGELMTLLLRGGLRMSEARCLTGRRVDFDTPPMGRVIVKEGAKGSKERSVTMIPSLARAMADLFRLEGIEARDHLWVNPGRGRRRPDRSKPISATRFYVWWARCLEDAGVRYRRPHLARHTFATRMYESGMRNKEVQLQLGHASSRTTDDTYIHVDDGQMAARMVELMGKL